MIHFTVETNGSAPAWESVPCPFCLEQTGEGRIQHSHHIAYHLEDIALAVLPKDVDSESDVGSDAETSFIASSDEGMHGRAVALFDFARENDNELPLTKGQVILVSNRHGQGWFVGQDPKSGDSGLVLEKYVRLFKDIEDGSHGLIKGDIEAPSPPDWPAASQLEAKAPTQQDPSSQQDQDHRAILNSTEADTYLDALEQFHKQINGTDFNRFPSVDKRLLDLFKLKSLVEDKGGFDHVCEQKKWAEIGRDLGYTGKIMSALSTSLKNSYQKWIQPYEEWLRSNIELAPPLRQQNFEPPTIGIRVTDNTPTGNDRRASISSVKANRDYILNLVDPPRPPTSGGEGGSASKRTQKHPAIFQCSLCPKRFTRAYNLRSHLRTHTNEWPFVCSVCGMAFTRQRNLKRHEGLRHNRGHASNTVDCTPARRATCTSAQAVSRSPDNGLDPPSQSYDIDDPGYEPDG